MNMNRHLHNFVVEFAWNRGYYLVDFISHKKDTTLVAARRDCWKDLLALDFSCREIERFFGRKIGTVRKAFQIDKRKKYDYDLPKH